MDSNNEHNMDARLSTLTNSLSKPENESIRKKTKTLTNEERLRAAKLVVDHNLPITKVANQFDVSWGAVQRASKRKRNLEEGLKGGTIKPKRKRQKGRNRPFF